MDRVEYAPEVQKLVLDDMLVDAGVQPLLHTVLTGVHGEGRRVTELHVHGKGGQLVLRPRIVVDASGDLDACIEPGPPS